MSRSDNKQNKKEVPARRVTRLQSTSQTEFIQLDSSGKPPNLSKTGKPSSSEEDESFQTSDEESFQSTKLESTFTHDSDESVEIDDQELINKIDRKINSEVNITTDQTDKEKIQNYKKIINNYRIYIIELCKKSKGQVDDLNTTITDNETNIQILQEKIDELQERINELMMDITAKDAILAIPVFSGDPKELETFIHTCDLYNQLIDADHRATLLLVIKAKVRGEALSKVAPLEAYNTWALLKNALKTKIKKPMSFEFAQEDLSKAFQKKDESVEDYAKRFRSKLHKLNEASRAMGANDAERAILQTANEKLAISKFEQNIRDNTVRILVSASAKTTLDESIQIALHKELMEKHKNIKNCGFCGLANHSEETCRKKKASENQSKSQRPNTSFQFKKLSSSSQKEENKDKNTNNDSNDHNKKSSFKNPNNGNNSKNNQKNVRFVEEPEAVTLQEALDEEEDANASKN